MENDPDPPAATPPDDPLLPRGGPLDTAASGDDAVPGTDTVPARPSDELADRRTVGVTAVLDELPASRRALLVALKRAGEASADELAAALEVTAGAVRQQIQALTAMGLLAARDEREDAGGTGTDPAGRDAAGGGTPGPRGRGAHPAARPGRPRRLHRLTPAADELFPRAYGDLTLELLDHAAAEDPAFVERLFARRREARTERTRTRLEGRDFGDRVAELARVLDEDGYLAEFERVQDDRFRITEHNCAVLAVAKRHGHACTSELRFLRDVLPDAEVERISHIASGAHACVYDVRRRTA